jgi:hypothetical protein
MTLPERAIATFDWAWMRGMSTLCRILVSEGDKDYLIGERGGATRDGGGTIDTGNADGFLPNLGDPATLGCLLALVRKAWKYPNAYVVISGTEWSVWGDNMMSNCVILGVGETMDEALVNALERAPGNNSLGE